MANDNHHRQIGGNLCEWDTGCLVKAGFIESSYLPTYKKPTDHPSGPGHPARGPPPGAGHPRPATGPAGGRLARLSTFARGVASWWLVARENLLVLVS